MKLYAAEDLLRAVKSDLEAPAISAGWEVVLQQDPATAIESLASSPAKLLVSIYWAGEEPVEQLETLLTVRHEVHVVVSHLQPMSADRGQDALSLLSAVAAIRDRLRGLSVGQRCPQYIGCEPVICEGQLLSAYRLKFHWQLDAGVPQVREGG